MSLTTLTSQTHHARFIKELGIALTLLLFMGFTNPLMSQNYQPINPYLSGKTNSSQQPYTTPMQNTGPNSPIQGQVLQRQWGASTQQWGQSENILIILDASLSMMDHLPGQGKKGPTKMAAAKQTILQVLKRVPPNVNIGLRVYGSGEKGRFRQCSDTRLVVPVAPNQQHTIASRLIGIQPHGATPISYSLIQAINHDFNHVAGKKTVLLVSDGMETCGDDPCRVAVDMQRKGINVKMNVIGFGLDDIGAQRQLKCIALSTFGEYHTANTSAELADQIGRALHAKTEVQGKILLPSTPPSAQGQPPSSHPINSPPANTTPQVASPPVQEQEYRM